MRVGRGDARASAVGSLLEGPAPITWGEVWAPHGSDAGASSGSPLRTPQVSESRHPRYWETAPPPYIGFIPRVRRHVAHAGLGTARTPGPRDPTSQGTLLEPVSPPRARPRNARGASRAAACRGGS